MSKIVDFFAALFGPRSFDAALSQFKRAEANLRKIAERKSEEQFILDKQADELRRRANEAIVERQRCEFMADKLADFTTTIA